MKPSYVPDLTATAQLLLVHPKTQTIGERGSLPNVRRMHAGASHCLRLHHTPSFELMGSVQITRCARSVSERAAYETPHPNSVEEEQAHNSKCMPPWRPPAIELRIFWRCPNLPCSEPAGQLLGNAD